MYQNLREKIAGKPGCDKCGGKGSYLFDGTSIFCESCHTQEEISAIYQNIDAHLRRQVRLASCR